MLEDEEGGQEKERVIGKTVIPSPMPSSRFFEGIADQDVLLPQPPPQPAPREPSIYDINHLSHDPGERSPIASYHVNDQDPIRRAYILNVTF